jgi:hypothetical protein
MAVKATANERDRVLPTGPQCTIMYNALLRKLNAEFVEYISVHFQ